MGETSIEWTTQRLPDGRVVTGYSANAWTGCTKVILPSGKPDRQCVPCYAERTEDHQRHRVQWGKGRPRTPFKSWRDNLRKWNAQAIRDGVYPFVFIQSLSDWADMEVPGAWRDDLFSVAEKCSHLTMLFLTKRVAYAAEYLYRRYPDGLPEHFWFGFSAGEPESLRLRLAEAQHVKAVRIFMSAEPYAEDFAGDLDFMLGIGNRLDWGLTGGTTDEYSKLAPYITHSDVYRRFLQVLDRYRIPRHFKQWGNMAPLDQSQAGVIPSRSAYVSRGGMRKIGETSALVHEALSLGDGTEVHGFLFGPAGKHAHGRMLDGRTYDEHPEVRGGQFPSVSPESTEVAR